MMRLKVGTMAQWGPKQLLLDFLRTYKKRAAIDGGSKLGQGGIMCRLFRARRHSAPYSCVSCDQDG